MNPSHIHTVQSTVRNGCVMFFGAIFEVPPELHVALQGTTVQVDYHVRDASGVRLRTQGDGIVCWAPRFGAPDTPQSTPVSPASTATERQSHTDGPSAQAVTGGHQTSAAALVEEYRSTEPLINAFMREQRVFQAIARCQQQIDELIDEMQALRTDGDVAE